MKTKLTLISLLIVFASSLYAAGLVDISYSPYTISQSGSYIVVADLTPGQDLTAITILCSNVTIDLNGHTLYGAGSTTGTLGNGVYAYSSCFNIMVKNGVVRDFRLDGISLPGDNHQITQIRAYNNGERGIYVDDCCLVWDNTVYDNEGHGIQTGMNTVVRDNCLWSNELYGIYVSNGNTITGNSVYGSGTTGIYGGTGSTVKGNTCYFNKGDGIQVSGSCQVVGNTCRGNYVAGIRTSSTDNAIFQNVSVSNNGPGLLSTNGCYFEQNKLSGNTPDESLGTSTEGTGELQNVIF